VPALIEIVADEDLLQSDAPGGGYAPVHAIELLGELRAADAVEPMLHLMKTTDWQDIAHDCCILSLPLIGEPVVEPALRELAATTKRVYRESLCAVLANTGVQDERILAALLDLLRSNPMAAAGDLATYGDPCAVPHLLRSFDELRIDLRVGPLGNQEHVEVREAITDLGGTLTPAQEQKFVRALEPRERWRLAMTASGTARASASSIVASASRNELPRPPM